jgi:hypothetical protein
MTDKERSLLLHVARWVVEKENANAEKLGTTNNWANEMRQLIEDVRRKDS